MTLQSSVVEAYSTTEMAATAVERSVSYTIELDDAFSLITDGCT